MHALVVGNADKHIDDVASAQLDPFFYCRRNLKNDAGIAFNHLQASNLAEMTQVLAKTDSPDILFLRPNWQESSERTESFVGEIRHRFPRCKLIFLDPWDQTGSRYFNILPHVDWLLKYQRLRDNSLYLRDYDGGSLITDYLANRLNFDLQGWNVSSKVPAGLEHRITTGWNFATSRRYLNTLRNPINHLFSKGTRTIDVFCHISLGNRNDKNSWYDQYRQRTLKILTPMKVRHRLAISGDYFGERSISSRQYLRDIRSSKIVISPFGWGEVTWRDYEAACHQCLLIKPSIQHVSTSPDIFTPGETYVPVRWDLSDLVEKCEYYLAHPEEAEQIAANANRAYRSYMKNRRFVKDIRHLLNSSPTTAQVVKPTLASA